MRDRRLVWRAQLAVLSERNFRLFFLGYATSLIGAAMVPVALTFAVLQRNGSATDVGYVLAAQTIPLVLLLLVGGVLADRTSRKTVMVAADLGRFASEMILAALLLTSAPSLPVFMVLAGMLGVGQALFSPALTGLIPQVVSPERLQEANALRGLANSTGQIAGPGVAGLLVVSAGPAWAIGFDAVTYAVSAYCIARLQIPSVGPRETERFTAQLRAGWREFRSRTWLWVIVAQFGLFHLLSYAPFMVLGAVVARTHLGGAAAWRVILTGQGIGAVLGGLAILGVRPARPLVAATCGTFAFALPTALLAIPASTPTIFLSAAASGAGISVFATLWDTTLQKHIPAEMLSRVSAYDWLGSVALVPLGFALVGPISQALGVSGTLWLASAWTVASSAIVLLVPSVRNLKADSKAAEPCGRPQPPSCTEQQSSASLAGPR